MPMSYTTSPHTIYSRPLEDTQIRLLALHPGENDERLVCRLHVVDVADKSLSYEAISYVWGTQGTPATIYCRSDIDDGYIRLSIPQNAADALEAVREPRSERLLWIDSICISQTSIDEKSAQVAMMDLIFANATGVLIWLGSENDIKPPAAEELFDRMAVWCRDSRHGTLWEALLEFRSRRWNGYNLPFYTADEIEMLLSIFECEWIWRLWCVQELVLAKKAWVHWGTVKMTWNIFSTVAIYIQSENQGIIARTGLAGIYNVTLLESFRRQLWLTSSASKPLPCRSCSNRLVSTGKTEHSRRPLPFSRLLSLTKAHGVTDRRDRIFSLLGLDHSLCHIPRGTKSEPPLAKPNYAQKIGDLYTSIAEKLLWRERSLYLLSFVQHQGDVDDGELPSWVPQWHVNNHRLITQFDLVSGHPANKTLEEIWRKSKTSSFLPPGALHTYEGPFHTSEEGVLQVNGLLLATVSVKCSEAVFADVTGDQWLLTLRHWLQDVVLWYAGDDKNYFDSLSQDQVRDVAFRVFYKTIFGGHLRHEEVRRDIESECKAFRSLVCLTGNKRTDCCPTTQAFVTQICRSRTLFFTTDGQLGIGPKYVQPGDLIFYLQSAAVPLLLRSRPQAQHRWALLGEVYVNGMVSTSEDYGPQWTSFADGKVRLAAVKALQSQQAHSDLTSGTFNSEKTLDRNTGKATTPVDANNSPHRTAQDPYDYRKRKDGTCGGVPSLNTFMQMPQCADIFHPSSRVSNESTSHPLVLDVSRESKLM
jgi:hypothetical protein